MRARLLMAVLGVTLLFALTGATAQQSATKAKVSVTSLRERWSLPVSTSRHSIGIPGFSAFEYRRSIHTLSYTKVRKYYLDKLGVEKEHGQAQAYVVGGKLKEGDYIWSDQVNESNEKTGTIVAVNTKEGTVTIDFRPENATETLVCITVAVHPTSRSTAHK